MNLKIGKASEVTVEHMEAIECIELACADIPVEVAPTALLAHLTKVVLSTCADYPEFCHVAVCIMDVLDANAKQHFKANH